MNLSGILVAIVAIAILTATGVSFYGNMQTRYGIDMPTDINNVSINLNTFNRTERLLDLAKRMEGETNETGITNVLKNIPILGEIGSITLGGVQMLTMLFEVPGMFTDMIVDVGSLLGLPPWIPTLIIAVIGILILMSIISAFVKWGGTE